MKLFIPLIIASFMLPIVAAPQAEYAAVLIKPELKKNANVVKRTEEIRFEILNSGEAVYKRKYALTILNENGDRMAGFTEYYDKFTEIRSVEAILYNAAGKLLKKAKGKEIMDISGSGDENLADDSRRKMYRFYYKEYPYTVEYEYEIKYKGSLFFPGWIPMPYEFMSVEQSRINVVFPQTYTVRYKSFNYSAEPLTGSEKDKTKLTWEIKNFPAIKTEFLTPDWYELIPVVFLGPTEFQIQGYRGNMNSWQDFGKFVYSLKQGRDELPENVRQTVKQLTKDAADDLEKIDRLYRYLQKNTRYISIQLGIGGWQPFDAKFVASKSYGDCKALTNYMYSLLKEAGISSYYTLVVRGYNNRRIIEDFPSQQFNHVILSIPMGKDTTWLECTSQTLPPGYIGGDNHDRFALIIDENGGKPVRTPRYGLKENIQHRRIKAKMDEEGNLFIKASSDYGGTRQDLLHLLIHHLSKDRVKEFLHEILDFATYDVNSFQYNENKTVPPSMHEELDITARSYVTITGKRLFIIPNVMTRSNRKLNTDDERKFDIDIKNEYRDTDEVEIELPKGFAPESMPQDVKLESKFGKYTASVKLEGNKILYTRDIEIYSGRFPASDYQEYAKFYEAIYKADRNRLVLVRTEQEPKKPF
jgi:hypothetical protein